MKINGLSRESSLRGIMMDKKFTDEDIINAAYRCIENRDGSECNNCKLTTSEESCVERFARYIVNSTKSELAPVAIGTSSEVSVKEDTDNIHLDDSTLLDICQEGLEEITKIYNNDYQVGYANAVIGIVKKLRGGDGK